MGRSMITEPATAWIDAARAGDENAAVQLVREHQARIYAFVRRLCGSEAEAVDLTQQTFCRAWSSLPGFAGRSSISTWLHGIAYRTYIDWRRSQRPAERRSDVWWDGLPDRADGPDATACSRDAAAVAYAAVDALGPEFREPVHLHYYQELTLAETAEVLGLATSTVKYRIREALLQVQRQLSPESKTLPPQSRLSR